MSKSDCVRPRATKNCSQGRRKITGQFGLTFSLMNCFNFSLSLILVALTKNDTDSMSDVEFHSGSSPR